MNQYKEKFFRDPMSLTTRRLSISSEELSDYWNSLSLVEMEKVLVIEDQYLICQVLVGEYLQYYLSNKKVSLGEYFYVMFKEKILMWVYDAKIFRQQQNYRLESDNTDARTGSAMTENTVEQEPSDKQLDSLSNIKHSHRIHSRGSSSANSTKETNDLISTYLIGYREERNGQKPENDSEEVFEFLDFDSVTEEGRWVLKVKESALMRIFPYLHQRLVEESQSKSKGPKHRGAYVGERSHKQTPMQSYDPKSKYQLQDKEKEDEARLQTLHEVILLQPEQYGYFIYNCLPAAVAKHPLYCHQVLVKSLFNLITHLMLNNLLLSWYSHKTANLLNQSIVHHYRFERYFRSIPKPKSKEEFTSMSEVFNEIQWQTFKLFIFQLKYKVEESEESFYCYQKEWTQEEYLINYCKYNDYYAQEVGKTAQGSGQPQLSQEEERALEDLRILTALKQRQRESYEIYGFGYRKFEDQSYEESELERKELVKKLQSKILFNSEKKSNQNT